MKPKNKSGLLVVVSTMTFVGTLCADTLTVDATANIFGAGHSTPPAPAGQGAGILPPSITFPAASGQVLVFSSVTGEVDFGGGAGFNGPDGFDISVYGMTVDEILSYGGIAGMRFDRSAFLVGVFLEDNEPVDPPPPRLDFTSTGVGTTFTNLEPQIGQTFFIGDGLTDVGSGVPQRFSVPATATRLFLGFADGLPPDSLPGGYFNNSGSLTAHFHLTSSCPPASIRVSEVEICWPSESNAVYQVEYRSDWTTNTWVTLFTNIVATGPETCVSDPVIRGTPQRFYRVICPTP